MISLLIVGGLCLNGASARVRFFEEPAAPAAAPSSAPAAPAGPAAPKASSGPTSVPTPSPPPAPEPVVDGDAKDKSPSPPPAAAGGTPPTASTSPPPAAPVAGTLPPPPPSPPSAVPPPAVPAAPVQGTPPPNADSDKTASEVKAEKQKLLKDSEGKIAQAAKDAAAQSKSELEGTGSLHVDEINGIADAGVAKSVGQSKDRIRAEGDEIYADHNENFKGTLAKSKHDAKSRVKDIKEHTAEVGGRVVSRANAAATKETIESAQKELVAFHEAEHEMKTAAQVATMSTQNNVNMWRKALEYAHAGKTFAVDAMKEAKKAQREAVATKEEVSSSLEHARLNTQATGVARENSTSARDAAADARLLADTVHAQVNTTKKGIEQANIDLDIIIKDTKAAAEEAKHAFMYARKVKESAPKKSAADEEAAATPSKDSEDATLLQKRFATSLPKGLF